jgi:RNA polymerase sigma factor (sigma-70 family)
MVDAHAPELFRLLNAPDPPTRDTAWDAFVAVHSRLLLHTARSLNHDHDAAMDGYAYVLEALRENEYRRLRAYAPDGRSKFSTWLVVVARRLCLDFHRQRYGRARDTGTDAREARAARRRLVDLVAEDLDASGQSPISLADPQADLLGREQSAMLDGALRGLPPGDRLLLTLRFEEDLSAREIAQVMGMATPFHVYRRLNAVLGSLRQSLRRRGVEDAG